MKEKFRIKFRRLTSLVRADARSVFNSALCTRFWSISHTCRSLSYWYSIVLYWILSASFVFPSLLPFRSLILNVILLQSHLHCKGILGIPCYAGTEDLLDWKLMILSWEDFVNKLSLWKVKLDRHRCKKAKKIVSFVQGV